MVNLKRYRDRIDNILDKCFDEIKCLNDIKDTIEIYKKDKKKKKKDFFNFGFNGIKGLNHFICSQVEYFLRWYRDNWEAIDISLDNLNLYEKYKLSDGYGTNLVLNFKFGDESNINFKIDFNDTLKRDLLHLREENDSLSDKDLERIYKIAVELRILSNDVLNTIKYIKNKEKK